MPKLTALKVKSAKPGRHADGEGLYLLVKPTGAKSWLLRIQMDGKRRDVGLGSVDTSPRSGDQGDDPIEIPILQRRVLTLGQPPMNNRQTPKQMWRLIIQARLGDILRLSKIVMTRFSTLEHLTSTLRVVTLSGR